MAVEKALILSNVDPLSDDLLFSNNIGTWNVSRALRDCAAGKHKGYTLDVFEAHAANASVEVDDAKVERFMKLPDVLKLPLVGVVEGGPLWLIDGHHRLRAMQRLGIKEFAVWIIEEADAAPYQVWYNGQRKAPWD
jgi:hypothetical protein